MPMTRVDFCPGFGGVWLMTWAGANLLLVVSGSRDHSLGFLSRLQGLKCVLMCSKVYNISAQKGSRLPFIFFCLPSKLWIRWKGRPGWEIYLRNFLLWSGRWFPCVAGVTCLSSLFLRTLTKFPCYWVAELYFRSVFPLTNSAFSSLSDGDSLASCPWSWLQAPSHMSVFKGATKHQALLRMKQRALQ